MLTVPVITIGLNILLALTPTQRWRAAGRQFNSGNFMPEHWFIITCIIVVVVLIVLFLVVSYKRVVRGRKVANELFLDYAEKRGLNQHERQILRNIADSVGLDRSESIFTMGGDFDRGTAKMIEESIAQQGAEESSRLKAELSFLREKLGFQRQHSTSIGSVTNLKELSSRQIPASKKVRIIRRTNRVSDDIEAIVVENNDMGLAVKLTVPSKITLGEFWRVRYYFGASVWEFDSSAVSYDGEILTLNHSDNVRFINRRRFIRVPINKLGFIAHFPFMKTITDDNDDHKQGTNIKRVSTDEHIEAWQPPEFIPAVVTELAGPGLRIEAPLDVKVGDRVLVLFKLGEEENQDADLQNTGKASAPRIIEDMGEVRHTKAIQNGLSIAVELIGLSDLNVNELIRITNAASLKTCVGNQDVPALADNKQDAEESVPVPTGTEGV